MQIRSLWILFRVLPKRFVFQYNPLVVEVCKLIDRFCRCAASAAVTDNYSPMLVTLSGITLFLQPAIKVLVAVSMRQSP